MRALCLVALAACSVDGRSEDFRCAVASDCTGDRVCDQGWCVAGAGAGDCPDACSECTGTTCLINCSNANACNDDIFCPAGFACEITCDKTGSCDGIDIDCSAASDCRISCAGQGSCSGDIACSDSGTCDIDCDGAGSCSGSITAGAGPAFIDCGAGACDGSIDCSQACACDVDCVGSCPRAAICPMGERCESADGGCNHRGSCDIC